MHLPRIGDVFHDKYEIRAVLGQGGYALVYYAVQVGAGREVALKVLEPDRHGRYPEQVESRFWREVKVVAKLRDPHAVTLFDFGRSSDGLLFMVFEYIPGEDLETLIERHGALSEAQTIHVMRQVLLCLREAHALGLLHRDIKPDNIRIFERAEDPLAVKVLDFGIATWVDHDRSSITSVGEWIGTPQFMSPEQIYGARLTPASDIYSLGLVAFQMLTGEPLVQGDRVSELFKQHASRKVRTLPEEVAVTPRFRELVERMVLHDAEARHQTADDVLAALDALQAPRKPPVASVAEAQQSREDVTYRENAPVRKVTEAPPTVATRAATTSTPDLRTLASVVGALLGGGALVIALLTLISGGDDEERQPAASFPAELVAERAVPSASMGERDELPAAADDERTPVDVARAAIVDARLAALETDILPERGCGAATSRTGLIADQVEVDLQDRRFYVYVPQSYDTDHRHPLMIYFHSHRLTPAPNLLLETKWQDVADREKFVILVPTSLEGEMGRPWEREDREAAAVRAMVDATAEALCIDETRIYGVGHGSGGIMALRARCAVPLAGLAVTSSRMRRSAEVCDAEQEPPTIWYTGERDGFYPLEGRSGVGPTRVSLDEHNRRLRSAYECADTSTPYAEVGDGVSCVSWNECEAPLVTCVHPFGHDYPGARYNPMEMFSAQRGGPRMQFPVTDQIWAFFRPE